MTAKFPPQGSEGSSAATAVRVQSEQMALPSGEDVDLEFTLPDSAGYYDLGSFFDPDTPTHIVPPIQGIYIVGLTFRWLDSEASAGSGSRSLTVKRPGQDLFRVETLAVSPQETTYGSRVTDAAFAPVEPIRVVASQTSGVDPGGSEDGVRVQVEFTLALVGTAFADAEILPPGVQPQRLGIGGDPEDSPELGGRHSRLVVFDNGLTDSYEPIIEVVGRQHRLFFHFNNVDDNYAGFYPWLFASSSYEASFQRGVDRIQFWYGMHTPNDKPASATLTFARDGTPPDVDIGVRAETLAAHAAGEQYFYVGEFLSSTFPLRIYPARKAIRLDLDEPDDALLDDGDFGLWLDPTPGATKVKFKAKDSNGAVKTGEVDLS
jgi:hypothetical protein